jgi:hypothetical protein
MNEDSTAAEALAKRRYFTIQAERVAGVVIVLLGLLVLNDKVAWPRPVGVGLVLGGLFAALFVPTLMAKRWKTPK